MNKILACLICLVTHYGYSQNNVQTKAVLLQRLLTQKHFKPVVWNDSSATVLYKKWIDNLDDEKLFFTQKEIDALTKVKNNIDDEILGKGWSFLPQSINLYKQQIQKVDSFIKIIIKKPLDFSKADNFTFPFSTFATTDAELLLRWQRYIKWEVLNYIAKDVADSNGLSSKPPVNFLQLEITARDKVKTRELGYVKNLLSTPQDFKDALEEKYLNTIAWCYDPHTNYFNSKKKNEFEAATSASEFSCGLEIDENDKGDIVIEYLQPGSSAWRSGQLHKGDVLQSVRINNIEKSVKDIDDEDLYNVLNGGASGEVELTVKSAAGEVKKVALQKEKIEDDEAIVKSYVLHGKQNIGYINLPGFYSREDEIVENEEDIKFDGCANDVSKEIIKLKKDTIAGLILDLRDNGGGSMWEAMQLAGIFIDIGPVASVKNKEGKQSALKDPNRGTIYDGPLLVLVNGASASASEFVSAALQDYKRAIIVGGTTYGKGTAQYVQPLDTNIIDKNKAYEDFVKITANKFYRVNGGTTQWSGVVPDIILPDLYSNLDYNEKNNESALQPDNVKPAYYKPLADLPLQKLVQKSAERVKANTEFNLLTNYINWQKKQNTNKVVALQWSSFATEYNEAIKMYKQMEKVKVTAADKLTITNNSFDWQRFLQSRAKSKEINAIHLKNIQDDEFINEAYKILMDWNMK